MTSPPAQPGPWHWHTLLNAPHRLGFFAAASVLSAASLWWAAVLLLRVLAPAALPQAMPAIFVHATVMVLGFMPLFFVGFLFTAGPRWLKLPDETAPPLRAPVLACTAGWALLLVGGTLWPALGASGVMLSAMGWSVLAWRFAALCRRSRADDRLHASVVAASALIGAAAMAAASLGLAYEQYQVVRAAVFTGLWLFIVPVYISVAHRMIPFFTANVVPMLDAWRPMWLLWALLASSWAQAGLWAADQIWPGYPAMLALRALLSGTAGLGILVLSWRWGLVQSLKIRLLAMLHLGFFWMGLGLALDAVSAALQLASAGTSTLGLAPLHAITMGFLGSTMIAMVTRVSCGHSGRTLVADNIAWGLFWLLQPAVLIRLAAAVWPAHSAPCAAIAAALWAAAMCAWSLRYMRWWGRPRVDGKAG